MAALAHGVVAAATTATAIVAAGGGYKRRVILKNLHASAAVYIGGSGVTTANGMPLAAGESMEIPGAPAIYGIVASGTVDVAYLTTQVD